MSIFFPLLLLVQVAELVASEFFEQGDMEREKLNIIPIVSEPICLIVMKKNGYSRLISGHWPC